MADSLEKLSSSVESGASLPSFREALRFWAKLGWISFGGPSGQIAIMHMELVERRRWIGEARFLHALNYCMLLPGPEAQQLATYIGWLLHGTRGGIAAGVLFVAPSAVILWALSWIYVTFGTLSWVAAIFAGLKPAVLAIVGAAVLRLGRRTLRNGFLSTLAAVAFAALFFGHVPFPAIVFGAALAGLVGGKLWPEMFVFPNGHGPSSVLADAARLPTHMPPTLWRAARVGAIWLAVWWLPIAALAFSFGPSHVLFREALFFSKAAMVTFGGAYAVLPYVAQQAVETQHWLAAPQMLDGLGLAETTPGPLIMVLQFVGFLGGWNQPGGLPRLLAGTLGALITTWTTFAPCFLWIFLGAPHIEQLRGNRKLTAALTAVTAAVVGVILNLAVWFGLQTLHPAPRSWDLFAVAVCAVSFVGLVRWKWGVIPLVVGAGAAGLLWNRLLPSIP